MKNILLVLEDKQHEELTKSKLEFASDLGEEVSWKKFILEKCLGDPTGRPDKIGIIDIKRSLPTASASPDGSGKDVKESDLGRQIPCKGCNEQTLGRSLHWGLCEPCQQELRPCLDCGESLKGQQVFMKRCGSCYAVSKEGD